MKVAGKYQLWILGAAIVLLDQLTKLWGRTSLTNIDILPFFSLTLSTNTGVAFGFFKGSSWLFFFIGLIVVGLIMFYNDKLFIKREKVWWTIITAGIIGNLIDRLLFQHVIDFINFHFWPIFNIADAALSIGVLALLIGSFKSS